MFPTSDIHLPCHRLVLCGLLAAAAVVALPGCAASPDLAAQTPERVHAAPADYAGNDCEMLERFLPVMQQGRRVTAGFQHTVYGWHVSAIEQVQRDKGCAEQRAASAAAARSGGGAHLNAALEPVTPTLARSLGLQSARGALVAASAAPTATGLRAQDVIVEIAGQQVQTPAELRAIVGLMSPGYQAPARVWREGAMVETVVVVAGPQATSVAARR